MSNLSLGSNSFIQMVRKNVRVERQKFVHPVNGLLHFPNTVRIHHQIHVWADRIPHKCGAAHVVFHADTTLHFEGSKSFSLGLRNFFNNLTISPIRAAKQPY